MIHARTDYDRIQDPAGWIPHSEPVFLIRGQDPCAFEAITAWIVAAEARGVDPEMIAAARTHLVAIDTWQRYVCCKETPDMPDGCKRSEESYKSWSTP